MNSILNVMNIPCCFMLQVTGTSSQITKQKRKKKNRSDRLRRWNLLYGHRDISRNPRATILSLTEMEL